jgi:hypothetical protein
MPNLMSGMTWRPKSSGNFKAIKFHLTTKGKDRGYFLPPRSSSFAKKSQDTLLQKSYSVVSDEDWD